MRIVSADSKPRAPRADLYSWSCPQCNFQYTEPMPMYTCFCGKEEEPKYNAYNLPHSCGNHCGKQLNSGCTHLECNMLCHPGPCPPCSELVDVHCHCGTETRQIACHLAARSRFSCRKPCSKLLSCLEHECGHPCHDGECDECPEVFEVDCYCGKERAEIKCGQEGYSCCNPCEQLLACGKHKCLE